MAYDRYDDRDRGYRGREDYGRERGYGRGHDGDDNWLERAGDRVRGWFAGDDDQDRAPGDQRGTRDRPYEPQGGYAYGGRDQGGWERSDRGYQGGYGRQGPREPGIGASAYGGQGRWNSDDAGRYADTYRSGGDFGHRSGASYGAGGYGDRNYGGPDTARGFHDPHYHEWRQRQMSELDRDYHEYRTENQRRFDEEFHSWRTARQGQRQALAQVREHQEVVGDDGEHVGTVDKVRDDQIILTRNDQAAGGRHHAIPSSWIQGVGEKVMLNRPGAKARAEWRKWERGDQAVGEGRSSRALGDRSASDNGPHVLERSFSGTYDRDD